MLVWLIYREEDAKKNTWYIHEMISEGEKAGLQIQLLYTSQLTLTVDKTAAVLVDGAKVPKPEAAIIRVMDPRLSKHLSMAGIRLFNSETISWLCNNKANTYQEISKLSIPIIPTVIVRRENLMTEVNRTQFPCVIKTTDGHGGTEVFLLTDQDNQNEKVQHIIDVTHSDFVIQPLVGTKHQDLRVYILGNQILTAILRTSKDGFRSNYSLGGSVEEYHLSTEERALVQTILDKYEFDLAGIDFIVNDDGKLIFNEIEDVVGARMLYQCTEINLVRLYICHIRKQLQGMQTGLRIEKAGL